jgi:hypothetical protein
VAVMLVARSNGETFGVWVSEEAVRNRFASREMKETLGGKVTLGGGPITGKESYGRGESSPAIL